MRSCAKVCSRGEVNQKPVVMLIDSGCTKTIVNGKFVGPDQYLGETMSVVTVSGETIVVPLAKVSARLLSGGQAVGLTVGVLDRLPVDVLLSLNDRDQLQGAQDGADEVALAVVTRGQLKAQGKEEARVSSQAKIEQVVANTVEQDCGSNGILPGGARVDTGPVGDSDLSELPLAGGDESSEDEGLESERELNRTKPVAGVDVPTDSFLSSTVLKEHQLSDDTLKCIREGIRSSAPTKQTGYFWKHGLIFRWYFPNNGERHVDQLIVPKPYRAKLLALAHDIPLAGHLGVEKTKDRVTAHFFWPGLYREVREYCQTCPECQRSARKLASDRGRLVTVPVIGQAFDKISMDIVGPLPRTPRGARYILTTCCYATRYPKAIPLKNELAETVADALLEIFSRLGIPKQIMSDQGTNFMSRLMSGLFQKLRVHKIKTTPYHPMANGLVERWNGTLKSMLKRVGQDEPKDWDLYLPYLLFAYREVPEASTGFSPFELVYGRPVRGPLVVLKESWCEEDNPDTSVVEHVLAMRERLAAMTELAHSSISTQQRRQKRWYDKAARDKRFEPGEQVLVLMPAAANKLQAIWQGPFEVVRKVSPVDYEIDKGRGRKRLNILHVNGSHVRRSRFMRLKLCRIQTRRRETWFLPC